MAPSSSRWIFTKEQIQSTPSRSNTISYEHEMQMRLQCATFMQELGQKLQVNQLCINSAIVYMHRFYMFHSFAKFDKYKVSTACVFLSCKVEEHPRKLESVVLAAYMLLMKDKTEKEQQKQVKEGGAAAVSSTTTAAATTPVTSVAATANTTANKETKPAILDPKSNEYYERAQEIILLESIVLQTLGFDVTMDHPHPHVLKICEMVKDGSVIAGKELTQLAYLMANNSLHFTLFSLQYKPAVIACVCVDLACRWSKWQIPKSDEGKEWFEYAEPEMTSQLLDSLTGEYIATLEKCPSKLLKKINHYRSGKGGDATNQGSSAAAVLTSAAAAAAFERPPPRIESPGDVPSVSVSAATAGEAETFKSPPGLSVDSKSAKTISIDQYRQRAKHVPSSAPAPAATPGAGSHAEHAARPHHPHPHAPHHSESNSHSNHGAAAKESHSTSVHHVSSTTSASSGAASAVPAARVSEEGHNHHQHRHGHPSSTSHHSSHRGHQSSSHHSSSHHKPHHKADKHHPHDRHHRAHSHHSSDESHEKRPSSTQGSSASSNASSRPSDVESPPAKKAREEPPPTLPPAALPPKPAVPKDVLTKDIAQVRERRMQRDQDTLQRIMQMKEQMKHKTARVGGSNAPDSPADSSASVPTPPAPTATVPKAYATNPLQDIFAGSQPAQQ